MSDFYEDDEPVENVRAAFNAGRRNNGELCARCGKPAQGFATINDKRYCHGDGQRPTCYMRASWEMSLGDHRTTLTVFTPDVPMAEQRAEVHRLIDGLDR